MEENKYLWMVLFGVLFVIGVEYLIARHKGLKVFRLQNTVSNILMGLFDRTAGLLMLPLTYVLYEYIYIKFSILDIPETTFYFVIAIFVTDFIWYIYHRSGHRINLFWGAHIIHHQSEDYNYSVALNLTPFQVIVRIIFWTVMPLIGFSPKMVLGTQLIIGAYQFLLHTTLIPKLGIIELLMVTPSHHRVHHGSNKQYLDKNFGGILIIWDRMFGTFQEEEEKVVFGITKDIKTRNFLISVFHYYNNLLFQMKQLPSIKSKVLLLFKGPDWVPESGELKLSNIYIDKGTYDYQELSKNQKIYIFFSVLFIICLLSIVGYYLKDLSELNVFVFSILISVNILTVSKLIENKKVLLLEIFKIIGILYLCLDIFVF